MNIVCITQEIWFSFIKKADIYTQFSGLKNLAKVFLWKTDFKTLFLNFKSYDYKLRFKAISVYLFDASVEGIKQNLFGPDINMEFLVLTFRTWLLVSAGFLLNFTFYAKRKTNFKYDF